MFLCNLSLSEDNKTRLSVDLFKLLTAINKTWILFRENGGLSGHLTRWMLKQGHVDFSNEGRRTQFHPTVDIWLQHNAARSPLLQNILSDIIGSTDLHKSQKVLRQIKHRCIYMYWNLQQNNSGFQTQSRKAMDQLWCTWVDMVAVCGGLT